MGLLVILLVLGALTLGAYLLYGRPRSTGRLEGLPEASIHAKDDIRDVRAASLEHRDAMDSGGFAP
jgi:hypothetical protein